MESELNARLRAFFKQFNQFMLLMWRLGLGPWLNMWPEVGGRIMLIAHTGRKSGQRRLTPVNYALIEGDVYCTAGFGSVADWYKNILADSRVEVILPDGWWEGQAEEIKDVPGNIELMRQVLIGSGVVAPLMGVEPKKLSADQLLQAVKGYKLVRIHRTADRTGPGGPGDLAWFWPAATFVLAAALFLRRKK